MARSSSDSELDSHRLRNILDSLISEISVPFLERRARSKSLKKNPIEELSYVISELTSREHDLHTCIGISKTILDRNDEISSKLKKSKSKTNYYKNLLRETKNDNITLQNDLGIAEEKNQQINAALIKAEEQLISLLAEHKRMLKENSTKQEKVEETDQDQLNEEVNELISRYKEHDIQLQSNLYIEKNSELDKKLTALREVNEKNEGIINSQKEQIFKIERELGKAKEKVKELEDELEDVENTKMKIEQKYKQLTFDYNRVKNKADKLSEDIQVIENASQKSVAKPKVRRHISLMSELEEFNLELTETPSEPKFFLSSPTNSNRLLISVPVQVACIMPKKVLNKRKNPLEEYFTLVRDI